MITVQLCGGIGNQMFQYAAGMALASERDSDITVDIHACVKDKGRPYRLDLFGVTRNVRDINRVSLKLLWACGGVFRERRFEYDPSFWDCCDNPYIIGYFQSEKYFKRIESVVRVRFETPQAKSSQEEESVAVHIRRGDYVNSRTFPSLRKEYYLKAMEIIESKLDNPVYHTFSDDARWSTGNSEFEDLVAMINCKHHIIANSSFSWWGAWLSRNKDKIVISPREWFSDTTINTNDLIPASWSRI